MPWCPKCRNEYYEGIKVCADCGCELVDSLEEFEEAERKEKEKDRLAQIANLQEMLKEADEELLEIEKNMESVSKRQEQMDTEDGFSGDGAGEGTKKSSDSQYGTEKPADSARGVYQNYAEKAADNKSSAYTLLGVGIIGLAVVILGFTDVIHFPINESSKLITFGVMGVIFLLFTVMGVVSMRNAGKYASKAVSEKELTKEVEKWFLEQVTPEKVDEGLFSEEESGLSEEQKYFKRFDRIKELIAERFLNLDEGYMDRFVDEHYQEVFSEQASKETETV